VSEIPTAGVKGRWVYVRVKWGGLERWATAGSLCAQVVIRVDERDQKRILAIEDDTRESWESWGEGLLGLNGARSRPRDSRWAIPP
jgi:hypothetical protein